MAGMAPGNINNLTNSTCYAYTGRYGPGAYESGNRCVARNGEMENPSSGSEDVLTGANPGFS